MSYIRCLSNPEGLYIWPDIDGTVKVTMAGKNFINEKNIPIPVFNGLIKKWNKNYQEFPCSYKDAKVEEIWFNTQNKISVFLRGIWSITYFLYKHGFKIQSIPKTKKELKDWKRAFFYRHGKYQIRLSYNDWHIDMWQVTWEHIARH
jgi:hypothetical protein